MVTCRNRAREDPAAQLGASDRRGAKIARPGTNQSGTTTSKNALRSQGKTRYFLDSELYSFDAGQLVNVAIVAEDGRESYAERTDFDCGCSGATTRFAGQNQAR